MMVSRRPRTGIFKQVLPGAESGEVFDDGTRPAPVKQDLKWSRTSERWLGGLENPSRMSKSDAVGSTTSSHQRAGKYCCHRRSTEEVGGGESLSGGRHRPPWSPTYLRQLQYVYRKYGVVQLELVVDQ
jgi:hypothetical protein